MIQTQAPTRRRSGLLRAGALAAIIVLVFFPSTPEVILDVLVKALAATAGVVFTLFLLCGGTRVRR